LGLGRVITRRRGVSGGLDQSVAAQRGRFEQIFPILIWKQLWCALRAS
jgi:hypothetical protein